MLIASRVASGAVALAAAAVVLMPYYVNHTSHSRKKALIAAGCMAALCLAALAAVYAYGGSSGTLHELSQLLHGHVEDSYGSSRVAIWRECLRLAGERPLVGGGPDTLALRTDMTFSRFVEETGSTMSTHVDNAHCEPLGYLVNLGALGAHAVCRALRGEPAALFPRLCAGRGRRRCAAVTWCRASSGSGCAWWRSARVDIHGPRVLREGGGNMQKRALALGRR